VPAARFDGVCDRLALKGLITLHAEFLGANMAHRQAPVFGINEASDGLFAVAACEADCVPFPINGSEGGSIPQRRGAPGAVLRIRVKSRA